MHGTGGCAVPNRSLESRDAGGGYMARSVRGLAIASTMALVVTVFTAIVARQAHALPRQPDVILIITDDQRYGTLGWLPAVHRYMREQGIIFTRAGVPTSVCCPSRASILTGQYAHTTKVWSNRRGWPRFVAAGMEPNTVAVWLRRAGYRTGLIGKYLNNFTGTGPPPGWAAWHSFTGNNADYYGYDLLHTSG